ncbi:asparagine synthase-related protein [Halorubellus litoreus]|uniref:Asparagine synthase-related protein n=1 Tax=Halorubellus litoreus TaxID=755308 RepID=A0ABD5VLX9_9EURY
MPRDGSLAALLDAPAEVSRASEASALADVAVASKELFGVFAGRESFDALAGDRRFDRVVEAAGVTVGVRSPELDVPNRTAVATDGEDAVVVWGEAFAPDAPRGTDLAGVGDETPTPGERGNEHARWLLDATRAVGPDALGHLNGSYLAVVAVDGDAYVATDPARSWDCHYTDDPGVRAFGTDATAISRAVVDPTPDVDAVREFLHLGVALGEKTFHDEVSRAPMDALVRADTVDEFERFVHADPEENDEMRRFDRPLRAGTTDGRNDGGVDWVGELAARLERAIARRSNYPGRAGVLLSAGYDSRVLLSALDDLDVAYTVGHPKADETVGARAVAEQYDVEHVAFQPDERYIRPVDEKVRYGQGVKESLHVHHAGYDDQMDVDTIYHGLLCDTFLTGHFLARDGVDAFGKRLPRTRLDPDPDPVDALLGTFGFVREGTDAIAEHVPVASDDPVGFVRDAVRDELDAVAHRAACVQDRIDAAGIRNQPSIPFRRHLYDNYRESFFVMDADLLDWHLAAPPEARNTRTFLDACRRIDGNVLDNRPPDRPYDNPVLNEVEGFVRRLTPFVRSFESAWPDRRELYARNDLDAELFPGDPGVHELPVRHKLRVHDARRWTTLGTQQAPTEASDAREAGSAD